MNNDNEQVWRDFCAAWSAHDWSRVSPCLSDDCVLYDIALARMFQGKLEIRTFFDSMLAFSADVTFDLKSVFGSGNRIASEFVISGTNTGDFPGMKATGRKYSLEVASIIEMRGGKIIRENDYSNGAALLQQLGWLPGAPATGLGRLVLKLMTKSQ